MQIEEIEASLLRHIKLIQQNYFQRDINDSSKNRICSEKSKLRYLKPFLDDNGVIRIGADLKHALIPLEQQHSIILPQKGHFFVLLIFNLNE